MCRIRLVVPMLLMGVIGLSLVSTASAAPVCGDRAKVIESLNAKYAEEPVAVGVTSNGGVIEVLKAPDGETWTILFTYPSGPSCLVASGDAWQDIEPVLHGPGT